MDFLNKINEVAADNAAASDQDRYIIYRRHAGIGDLLLGLYYTWVYACATKRKIVIDWRWSTYVHNSSNLFPYLFKDCFIRGTPLIGTDIDKIIFPEPFYPKYYNNETIHEIPKVGLHKTYKNYMDREADFERLRSGYPYLENTVVLNECLRAFPHGGDIAEGAGNFINIIWSSLNGHLSAHLDEISKTLFDGNKNITGIHIRLGNNADTFTLPFIKRIKGYDGKNVREYVKRNVMPVIENLPSGQRVFVASETEEATNQIIELVPDCIIYNKWFADPGCEVHFSSRDRGVPNGLEILKDSLTEMYLLSQCQEIYSTLAHSAFSKVAGLLGKKTNVHFI